jgi:hypothetical protein
VEIGQSCTGLVDYKMKSLCLSNLFFDATEPIEVGCVCNLFILSKPIVYGVVLCIVKVPPHAYWCSAPD